MAIDNPEKKDPTVEELSADIVRQLDGAGLQVTHETNGARKVWEATFSGGMTPEKFCLFLINTGRRLFPQEQFDPMVPVIHLEDGRITHVSFEQVSRTKTYDDWLQELNTPDALTAVGYCRHATLATLHGGQRRRPQDSNLLQ